MGRAGLLLCVALAGCTGLHKEVRTPSEPLLVRGVVVYPVRIQGDEAPAWRTFELGERVVASAVEAYGQRVSFFGPTEIDVKRWDDEGAWVASSAVPLLVKSGVPPAQALVLRANVEKRVASHQQDREDAKGKARGSQTTEETTWVVRVDVLHPSSHLTLVEVGAQVTVDPFAPATPEDDFDPAAALTHLVLKLEAEALEAVVPYMAHPNPPPPEPVVTLAESPAHTAAFPDPAIARLDALSLELWLVNRARFLSPTLSDLEAGRVAKAERGLVVLQAPASAGVQAGDLIVEVDGALPERQVLARKRLKVTPVQVKVRRAGGQLETTIP